MSAPYPDEPLWSVLVARAEEILRGSELVPGAPHADHVLYVRVPVGPKPNLAWGCRLDSSGQDHPADTPSYGGRRLADTLWAQLQEQDLWSGWEEAGWEEAGWRVGARISPALLNAIRHES
jgi:hypothetical protein